MLFTTQQLQGGPRFSHKTRIGNWNEDLGLEEIKYLCHLHFNLLFSRTIDYNQKAQNSQLGFHKTLSKVETSYKKVPWSFSPDGILRNNDLVMISN